MPRKDFWFALVGGSLFASGLSIFRTIITDDVFFTFLLLNLGLAWIPLLLALFLPKLVRKKQFFLYGITLVLWLLFFPNSLYIITDFIHLKSSSRMFFVFDLVMLFSFALNGIILGLTSLYLMEKSLYGHVKINGLSSVLLIIGSCGITIGRFLRWNSWDILLQPMVVIWESFFFLLTPYALVFTILMSFFSIFLYYLIRPILVLKIKN